MSRSDFIYGTGAEHEAYAKADTTRRNILDLLTQILFDVQYAKPGSKTAARRDGALSILTAVETSYKLHRHTQLDELK